MFDICSGNSHGNHSNGVNLFHLISVIMSWGEGGVSILLPTTSESRVMLGHWHDNYKSLKPGVYADKR